jgi:hypothetical protein
MIGLLLLGLAALVAGAESGTTAAAGPRPPLAQVAAMMWFTLSALVKYLTGVACAFLLLVAARQARRGPARVARMLWLAAVGVLVAAALFAPWLELPDSLDSLVEQTGGLRYANALPDKLALAVSDQVLAPMGMGLAEARDLTRLATKVLTLVGFLGYLAWEARGVWLAATTPRRSARALALAVARSTLVYILVVSVWVQTWYFALPLAAAVLLGLQAVVARFAVAVTLTALPCLYWSYYLQESTPDGVFAIYAAVPLAVLGWGLLGARGRARRTTVLADARPVRLAADDGLEAGPAQRPPRPTMGGHPGREAPMGAGADAQSA